MTTPVYQAQAACQRLEDLVDADLDETGGGIGWWTPQIGWKHSALLGDYLLASIHGIPSSLKQANLAITKYDQTEHAQNHALRTEWATIRARGGSIDDLVSAGQNLGRQGAERELLLTAWNDHAITSMAQALDRMAAAVLTVAGVRDDILKTDWGRLNSLAKKAPTSSAQVPRQGTFADPGTPGRALQITFLSNATSWQDHGPQDWLPWLLAMRNTNLHRAPLKRWHLMIEERSQAHGYIVPMPVQPAWAETAAMARTSSGSLTDLVLHEPPGEVLHGLLGSVASLITSAVTQAADVWTTRRTTPSMIIQPGGSWPNVDPAELLHFPGYGTTTNIKVIGGEIHMSPQDTRRLKAARIFQPELWQNPDN